MRLCDVRIAEAHRQLESPSLSPSQTDIVRGRIVAWRELKGMNAEEPDIT